MKDLYRKSSMDKLSSPEQLDQMLSVTPPAVWVAIVGGALCVAALLIWSITAWLPTRVSANGVFVADQNTYSFASQASGIVREVNVAMGDEVHAGDALAVLDTKDGERQLADLNERLDAVKAVTLTSTDDKSTSDNVSLLNLKTQLSSLNADVQQQKLVLDKRRKELASLTTQTTAAKAAMDAAREALYASLPQESNLPIQLRYQEAQTSYSYAWQNYQSLVSGEYQNVVDTAFKAPQTILSTVTSTSVLAGLSTVYQAVSGLFQYPVMVQNAKEKMDAAKSELDAAQAAYEEASAQDVALSAEQQVLNDNYSAASSAYNMMYSRQVSLQETVNTLEIQILTAIAGNENSANAYMQQFEDQRAAVIDSLEREIEQQEENIDKYTVRATEDGSIIDVPVRPGAALSAGGTVAVIRQVKTDSDDLIKCYVPISTGKQIEPGMTVLVYPTTVNRQEYGHMEATVISVDSYVSSTSELLADLGVDSIVSMFSQSGPVISLDCKLKTDDSTASGYYWSSKKGASVTLSQGTLVTAEIVVERRHPITMLIPKLKEWLTTLGSSSTATAQ